VDKFTSVRELVAKYGVIGSIAILMPFFAPYINEFLDTRQKKLLDAALARHRTVVFRHADATANDLKKDLRIIAATKTLTNDQALYIMRAGMGYQSIFKISWLDDYLSDRGNGIKDTYFHRQAIKLELVRQSQEYINKLNSFSHKDLGRLGDYVASNFPMDEFLNRIYLIVFDENLSHKEKVKSSLHLMLDMQNTIWSIAAEKMN